MDDGLPLLGEVRWFQVADEEDRPVFFSFWDLGPLHTTLTLTGPAPAAIFSVSVGINSPCCDEPLEQRYYDGDSTCLACEETYPHPGLFFLPYRSGLWEESGTAAVRGNLEGWLTLAGVDPLTVALTVEHALEFLRNLPNDLPEGDSTPTLTSLLR